jgi:hypothetical protein
VQGQIALYRQLERGGDRDDLRKNAPGCRFLTPSFVVWSEGWKSNP